MYQLLFISQCNQNYATGKWTWRLNLGMQQENLSAANIDAASSWTQTRDDFINIVIFNYVRNNLNTKKTCQYCFQDGPVALILLNLLWNTLLQAQLFSPPCWSILKNHSLQLKKVHVLHQKCPYTNKGSEWIWKALSKSTCTLQ